MDYRLRDGRNCCPMFVLIAAGILLFATSIVRAELLVEQYYSLQLSQGQNDTGRAVSVDSLGNVFVVGNTHLSAFESQDGFVSKFGSSSTPLWTSKLRTTSD